MAGSPHEHPVARPKAKLPQYPTVYIDLTQTGQAGKFTICLPLNDILRAFAFLQGANV